MDKQVKEYLRLVEDIHKPIKEKEIDLNAVGASVRDLIESSRENGFALYSMQGENPRAIVYGFSHVGGEMNQEKGLCSILKKNICKNDMLLMEGGDPFEVIYKEWHGEDLIGELGVFLSGKNARTMLNGNSHLAEFNTYVGNLLYKLDEESLGNRESDEFAMFSDLFLSTLKTRDFNFCNNSVTGMIPLIDGSTENYKKLDVDSRVFQLVGALHVFSNNIINYLEKSRTPYAAFIAKEMPRA